LSEINDKILFDLMLWGLVEITSIFLLEMHYDIRPGLVPAGRACSLTIEPVEKMALPCGMTFVRNPMVAVEIMKTPAIFMAYTYRIE
jgi:hypothetical protein